MQKTNQLVFRAWRAHSLCGGACGKDATGSAESTFAWRWACPPMAPRRVVMTHGSWAGPSRKDFLSQSGSVKPTCVVVVDRASDPRSHRPAGRPPHRVLHAAARPAGPAAAEQRAEGLPGHQRQRRGQPGAQHRGAPRGPAAQPLRGRASGEWARRAALFVVVIVVALPHGAGGSCLCVHASVRQLRCGPKVFGGT